MATEKFVETIWTKLPEDIKRALGEEVGKKEEEIGKRNMLLTNYAFSQIGKILKEMPGYGGRGYEACEENETLVQIKNTYNGFAEIVCPGYTDVEDADELPTVENTNACYYIFKSLTEGIYANHQFEDIKTKVNGTSNYKKWFNASRDSYLFTIPFKQILALSDYNRYGKFTKNLTDTFDFHGGTSELGRVYPGLGYRVGSFKFILEHYLHPYLLASAIGHDVHLEEFYKLPHVVFKRVVNGKEINLAISLSSKEVFYVNENRTLKCIGNSYEYMFKALSLPIKTVLDTTLFALGKSYMWFFPEVDSKECDLGLTIDLSYAAARSECEEAYQLTKKGNPAFFDKRIPR